MTDHLESTKKYLFDLRSVSTDCKTIKICSNKISYTLNNEVDFDIDHENLSSLDYFIGAIASSMMFSIIKFDRKHDQLIEEIEGKFSFTLENPLTYLSVRGYDEKTKLSNVQIIFYIVTFSELDKLEELCKKAINNSVVYQTIKSDVKITYSIKVLL